MEEELWALVRQEGGDDMAKPDDVTVFETELQTRFKEDKRKKELEVKGLFETLDLKDKKIHQLDVQMSEDGNVGENEYVIIEQKARQMAKYQNLENHVREIAKGAFRVKGYLCQLKLKREESGQSTITLKIF